jgi:hypothetical protein
VEFLVRTPPPNGRPAQLITTSINTGLSGDCDPERPIFEIVTEEEPHRAEAKNAEDKMGAFSRLNTAGQRFAKLGSAPVAQSRVVYFDEKDNPEQFFMAVEGQPEMVFDPNAPPAITATQGTVERWTAQNRTTENHEFHIHQIHFLVESQNNFKVNGQAEAPAIVKQYLDMIEVPAWDGKRGHPFPSVTLLLDFRGPDIGNFVFHCHILEHEDGGMMNIIEVVPGANARNGGLRRPAAAAEGAEGGAGAPSGGRHSMVNQLRPEQTPKE